MSLGDFLQSRPIRKIRDGVEVVQAALFLLALAGGVLGALLAVVDGLVWSPTLVILILVSMVVILGVVALIPLFRTGGADSSDFSIEELDGTLRVSSRPGHREYSYVRRQTVRANRDGLRLVCIRSHWSGQSREESRTLPLIPGHTLLDGGIPEEDGRIYRWIYLLGPVAKRQRVEVGIRHTFRDDFSPMKPYYRESGEERRVRRMRVTVIFDADCAPEKVEGVIWKRTNRGYGRQDYGSLGYSRSIDQANGLLAFVVEVGRPRRGCAYGLRWQWPAPPTTRADENALLSVVDGPYR